MHCINRINVNIISRFLICVPVCMHIHMGDSGSQKVSDPGSAVTGHFEVPDRGAGNQIPVLSKSSKSS